MTVNPALPLFPSLDALMVADPAATPEIVPVFETVATEVLELCQVMLRPDNEFPLASFSAAVACAD